MAYSSGFSPHPRISYANAAPTGAASEAEYVEIALVQEADPQAVRAALDESLPEGLDVLEVVVSPGGGLADRLEGSRWQVEVPGVPEDVSARAIEEFLASGEVLVERLMKNGVRSFDAREPVLALRQCGPATLDLVVRHGTPLVRPDDVLRALGAVVPEFAPTAPARITRLAQGPLTGSPEPAEIIGDPFA
jgi:radical SAM-linked protein